MGSLMKNDFLLKASVAVEEKRMDRYWLESIIPS